jgi:Peptidase family S51
VSGLIAVLGGQEHHPGCEPIDRRLLAESGLSYPTVTILLAATVPNRIRLKILEATNYWPGLGARVRVCDPGGVRDVEHALRALDDTDLVVLTGGRPWLMRASLTAPIIRRLRDLSRDGVPLSGSSAGAMALCSWRMHLQPGVTPRLERGLGFVPGLAAPHYGRHGIHHACRVVAYAHPRMDILGLQDRTALVGRNARYQVMGAGSCTIVRDATRRRYRSGDEVRLSGTPRTAPATSLPAPGLAAVRVHP